MRRRRDIARFVAFRKHGEGREALVVGLGPTGRTLDGAKVRDRQNAGDLDIFVVNGFCDTELAASVTPNFYILADPLFFDFDDRTTMPNSSLHPADVWRYLREHPEVRVFIPHNCRAPLGFDDTRVVYFNGLGLEGFSRNIDATRPRGFLSMAAYNAMSVAVSMGFRRVLIVGIENSWFLSLALTSGGKVALKPHHSYDLESGDLHEIRIFREGGVPAFFEDISRLFGDLRLFRGRGIENLDAQTVVDVFPVARDRQDYLAGNSR
ncbi:hypothetical protein [Demequina lutea]|uniref:Uncharacterized protein n=1 Tax=Demequina lutea TaxID=431489 RepID=A0A7Z0CJ64_9MICO|nr:hypothetical protein [Demequina lutea]NYI40427.1 hypothetical protein [Demequina lutea]